MAKKPKNTISQEELADMGVVGPVTPAKITKLTTLIPDKPLNSDISPDHNEDVPMPPISNYDKSLQAARGVIDYRYSDTDTSQENIPPQRLDWPEQASKEQNDYLEKIEARLVQLYGAILDNTTKTGSQIEMLGKGLYNEDPANVVTQSYQHDEKLKNITRGTLPDDGIRPGGIADIIDQSLQEIKNEKETMDSLYARIRTEPDPTLNMTGNQALKEARIFVNDLLSSPEYMAFQPNGLADQTITEATSIGNQMDITSENLHEYNMENITGKDKETREIENIVNYKTPDEQIDEFRHIFSDKKSDPDNTKLNIISSDISNVDQVERILSKERGRGWALVDGHETQYSDENMLIDPNRPSEIYSPQQPGPYPGFPNPRKEYYTPKEYEDWEKTKKEYEEYHKPEMTTSRPLVEVPQQSTTIPHEYNMENITGKDMTDSQKSNYINYLKNKEQIERENPSSVWSQLPAEIGKEIVPQFLKEKIDEAGHIFSDIKDPNSDPIDIATGIGKFIVPDILGIDGKIDELGHIFKDIKDPDSDSIDIATDIGKFIVPDILGLDDVLEGIIDRANAISTDLLPSQKLSANAISTDLLPSQTQITTEKLDQNTSLKMNEINDTNTNSPPVIINAPKTINNNNSKSQSRATQSSTPFGSVGIEFASLPLWRRRLG